MVLLLRLVLSQWISCCTAIYIIYIYKGSQKLCVLLVVLATVHEFASTFLYMAQCTKKALIRDERTHDCLVTLHMVMLNYPFWNECHCDN